MPVILAADIGGTKTLVALYQRLPDGSLHELRRVQYISRDYPGLLPILRVFLGRDTDIAAATFGIAGPVEKGVCRATNLPWIVDASALSRELDVERVTLLNDFHATAIGVAGLGEKDVAVLQEGKLDPDGPMALIGAGTGLGEAIILPSPQGPRVLASEGGHCDFAPRNALEIGLLQFLLERHPRVSVERVVSGQGLRNIYDYLVIRDIARTSETTRMAVEREDAGSVIGKAAMDGSDPACTQAIEMFIAAYGAEAGNLALKCLPTGGVFIAGGIAPRLLTLIQRGEFMRAFGHKGRMSPLLERMRVSVVLNPELGLLGARDHANRQLATRT